MDHVLLNKTREFIDESKTEVVGRVQRGEKDNAALFTLTDEVLMANEYAEVLETCKALDTVGALKLPFEVICVQAHIDTLDFMTTSNPDRTLESIRAEFPERARATVQVYCDGVGVSPISGNVWATLFSDVHVTYPSGRTLLFDPQNKLIVLSDGSELERTSEEESRDVELIASVHNSARYAVACLLAALATPCIVKESVINKRAGRGIGNGDFRSADRKTIFVSRTRLSIPAQYDSTGRRIKPHVRRGHIREQRYKDDFREWKTRPVFIAPVNVNAPKDFELKPNNYSVGNLKESPHG